MLEGRRLLAGLAFAGLGAACQPGDGAADRLDGTWQLRSGAGPRGEVVMNDTVDVLLTIDGTDWTGSVCNRYVARDVEVDGTALAIGDVARTEMACLDRDVMDAEDAYLAAFAEVTGFRVDEETLTLRNDEVELVYRRAEAREAADG
ncbi:META domain-containing protein [Egicoccus sp. AB-alg2]|uniref:META domain-containing protein n=1 Tax=Egicoccus sp. AB-alg2 TaxID=3242693 RepID=UPI00359DD9CB